MICLSLQVWGKAAKVHLIESANKNPISIALALLTYKYLNQIPGMKIIY